MLGGGRVLGLVERLEEFRTLERFADDNEWDYGEGFIEATPPKKKPLSKTVVRLPAAHVTGKPLLPSNGIKPAGIDKRLIGEVKTTLFRTAYTEDRYTPPMVLIHEQCDLNHGYWDESYLTYKNQIVGICGRRNGQKKLRRLATFLAENKRALQAYVAGISVKMFTQHATTLSAVDVLNLPYPETEDLQISPMEKILVDDIVDFLRDHIRLGEKSVAARSTLTNDLEEFNHVFIDSVNTVYKKNLLRPLDALTWSGMVCQPYMFGKGELDWDGDEELQDKLNSLLVEERGAGLQVTRIARIYDGNCIYLLKPNSLRYWLRSVALRDADETLADLWNQGF